MRLSKLSKRVFLSIFAVAICTSYKAEASKVCPNWTTTTPLKFTYVTPQAEVRTLQLKNDFNAVVDFFYLEDPSPNTAIRLKRIKSLWESKKDYFNSLGFKNIEDFEVFVAHSYLKHKPELPKGFQTDGLLQTLRELKSGKLWELPQYIIDFLSLYAIPKETFVTDRINFISVLEKILEENTVPEGALYFSDLTKELISKIDENAIQLYQAYLTSEVPTPLQNKIKVLLRKNRKTLEERQLLLEFSQKKFEKKNAKQIWKEIANHLFVLQLTSTRVPFSSILSNIGIQNSSIKPEFIDDLRLRPHTLGVQQRMKKRMPLWAHPFIDRLRTTTDRNKTVITYSPGRFPRIHYSIHQLSKALDTINHHKKVSPNTNTLTSSEKNILSKELSDKTVERIDETFPAQDFLLASQVLSGRVFNVTGENLYSYFPLLNSFAQKSIGEVIRRTPEIQNRQSEILEKIQLILEVGSFDPAAMGPDYPIHLQQSFFYPELVHIWGGNLSREDRLKIVESLKKLE